MSEYVFAPYEELYEKIIQYCVGQFVICVVFIVLDIINFVYVYQTELKYYLVTSSGKAFVLNVAGMEENANHNDGEELDLDFLKDPKKWVKVNDKDSERDRRDMGGNGGMADDFRVTMAMNLNSVPVNNQNESIHVF